MSPGFIAPTPNSFGCRRAIEDAIQLDCFELTRIIFELTLRRQARRKEGAAPGCVTPTRSSDEDASHRDLQQTAREHETVGARAVCSGRRFWLETTSTRRMKQSWLCTGYQRSIRPQVARRSWKSTSKSSCQSPRPTNHRWRRSYRNGLCTKKIAQRGPASLLPQGHCRGRAKS